MAFIIATSTIIIGYILFLLSIGHLILVIRIANPVTKILKSIGILKYGLHAFYTTSATIVFVLITYIFYQYFNNFFPYLILGYLLSSIIIIKNFKIRYTFNESSFKNWYLKDYSDKLNFDNFPNNQKAALQDTNNLFNFISTILKSKNKKHE